MKAKVALKIVLTFLMVGAILYIVGIDRFVLSFREMNPYLFMAALAGSPLVLFASSRKWMEIIKQEATGISYSEAFTSFLAGLSLGLLTPGRIGEFGKVGFIRQGRLAALGGIALLDRVIDLKVVLALGIAGSVILFGILPGIAVLAATLFCASVVFHLPTRTAILNVLLVISPWKDQVRVVIEALVAIPPGTLIRCVGYRLLACSVDICQFYLLINSFSHIGILDVLVVYPAVILTNILPLTIGGIGVREGMSVYVLSYYQVSPEAAASASLLLFVINTLLPALIGAVMIPRLMLAKRATGSTVSPAASQL
jgi:glycosyltransferase 2 family protein